jgi:prephenate dehydrogenase
MKFDTIGFIGLGLIGGSIAKKIKKDRPKTKIYATAHHEETIREAYREGLIENDSLLPLSAFAACDCIFLCAPVQRNIDYLRQLKDIINPGCYITDVGSTKTEIHEEVIRLGMEESFIGGHPMTGSEKTGIGSASETLLENAYYIITPTAVTPDADVAQFRDFVVSLGSIPLILDYKTHDYSTGAISHLPHMIAYTLVNLVRQIDDNQETMKTIAAGGFRDITRIASSSPVMWQNICASNREPILTLIDQYIALLQELRTHIDASQEQALLDFFRSAKDYRDSMALPSVKSQNVSYELFVDLVDEAGGLASVTRILADHAISIKNISIINNREYEEGVLLLNFADEDSRTQSERVLAEKDYTVHRRR